MATLSARPAACLNESNHGISRCNAENVATVEGNGYNIRILIVIDG